MDKNLDTLVRKIQTELQTIDREAAEWKTQNESRLSGLIQSEHQENSGQLKELKVQLMDIESKRSTIKKYYAAYLEEASAGVRNSKSCQPVPVNMNLYKNQLINPNKQQAADTIVTMARSNLEYLKNQEEDIQEKIQALSASGNLAKKQLEMLESEMENRYKERYTKAFLTADMLYLNDQNQILRNEFEEEDWDSFFFEEPSEPDGDAEILVGSTLRRMELPSYAQMHALMIPSWKNGMLQVPVCVPLSGFHMLVNYHVSQAADTKEGLRTLIGNLLKRVPVGSMRVYPFDLETYNAGAFGGLTQLTGPAPAFLAPVPGSEDAVLKGLKSIYDEAASLSKKMAGCLNLQQYNEQLPEGERAPYRVLVLYGCPEGLSSKALEYFKRIYHMSRQCGISIIAVHNSNSDVGYSESRTFYENLKADALTIECTPSGQFIRYGEEKAPFEWQQGLNTLSEYSVERIMDAYGALQPGGEAEEDSIADCFREIRHTRGNRSLNLAFGTNELGEVSRYACQDMNFASYISGSAGCGKSTLMHTLITGILLNCHPEDAELWLVDFKMTEFQLYAKYMPPHVKRVVLESSEEVVLDLIDELTDILDKRMKLLNKYHLKDITQLPEEFRMKHLPLIIVMVDEFATMTQIIRNAPLSGNLSYAEKMENLLAKGRTPGFRFIFADQAYEAGISGLTPKSKHQIGQRFAMANKSQYELKETLSLPKEADSEEVQHWMSTLPPHHVMTAETEEIEETLEHVVKVHRSQVAFVPQDRIIEIIEELNKRYKPVASAKELKEDTYIDKKPLVVDGQRIYTFKESKEDILDWEGTQDYPQEVKRLYLGRPCALRKESPVELKPAPGENLLLMVEDRDMAASEIMSAIESVSMNFREPSKITILADRLDPLYRRYRDKWQKYNCLTDMTDICEKINEIRRRAEKNQTGDELIVVMGIYNLYQEWDELPDNPDRQVSGSGYYVKPVKMSAEPSPLVSQLGDAIYDEEDLEDGEDYGSMLEFGSLFGEEDETVYPAEENNAEGTETAEEAGYNAIEDFRWLLTKGPARGYHFLVTLSQYSEYRELQWQEKMFRHLVYQWMAKDELTDIIGYGRSAAIPNGALRYVSKKDAFSLRPYLWPDIVINGWTMDEDGKAVEACDEDDEFI